MRHIITTTLLLLVTCFAGMAQTIPNADFENWTGSGKAPPFDWEEPTGWSSANPMTEFISAGTRRTSPGQNGDSACLLKTLNIFGENAPAFIVNGSVELDFGNYSADFRYSGTPVSTASHYLHGYYKFTSTISDDSAFAVIAYKKWNSSTNKSDTIAQASLLLPQVSQFTEFQVDISQVGSNAVDSVVIIFVSSNPSNVKAGGEFIVDNISMDMINSTGHYPSKIPLTVYPNPASDKITITTGTNEPITHIRLVDITGKTVLSKDYNHVLEARLELNELLTGIYFVQVTTNNGIATEKLTVIK